MKSLRRLISILLTVSCFMMAVTGAYIIYRADKHYEEDGKELGILSDKIDRYSSIQEKLESDAPEYRRAKAGLAVEWEVFNSKSMDHRNELVTYTATKSGIKLGEEQIASAWAPLQSGKEQLEQADALLEAGTGLYDTAKNMMDEGWAQYESSLKETEAELQNVEKAITECSAKLTGLFPNGGNEPTELPEEYRQALEAYDMLSAAYQMIQTVTGYSADNPDSVALADAMASLLGYASYAQMGAAVADLKATIDKYLNPEQKPNAPDSDEAAQLQAQLMQLQAQKEMLLQRLSELDTLKSTLETAATAVEVLDPMVESGREQLEAAKQTLAQGEAALYTASQQMKETKAGLEDTNRFLTYEIPMLAAEKAELLNRQSIVDDYEHREESLKESEYRLLNYEEIRLLTDEGESIYEAAASVFREKTETADRIHRNLILSGILTFFSLLAGFAGIFSEFGKLKLGVLGFLPATACFLSSLAIQKLRYTGIDTMMYSALITAVLAAVALVIFFIPDGERN